MINYRDYICSTIDSFFNTDDFCNLQERDREHGVRDLLLVGTVGSSVGFGLGVGGIVGLSNGLEAISQPAFENLSATLCAAVDLSVGITSLAAGAAAIYFTHKLSVAIFKEIRLEKNLSFDRFTKFLHLRP